MHYAEMRTRRLKLQLGHPCVLSNNRGQPPSGAATYSLP